MSKKRRLVEDFDPLDDAALFAEDSFDVDEFIAAHGDRKADRRDRKRGHARRRLEAARDRRWLKDQLATWEDFSDDYDTF